MPPIAGPANIPTLATVFIAAFAAVSSSGLDTSDGRSAPCAGAKSVETIERTTASAKTGTELEPCQASAAIAPSRTTRTRSVETMTRCRERRSASTASHGAASAAQPHRAAKRIPT